jgi:hypothetical protein
LSHTAPYNERASTSALVSAEHWLATALEPDRECADGAGGEQNLRQLEHGDFKQGSAVAEG